ncbi:DNA polymerase IV [Endozoicomonas ascidiicola]|uniref:DNA polymerase IV n=1 Tax=Endozoicomonas ascidiicola TaxID=1698521 RepID=UPI0008353CD4|nr:DNA polymerase IV [Endozoicomonas ascidiicola]
MMDSNANLEQKVIQRKIIHVDFDAFYASIEIRDNPKLSGRPVAVGGASDRRGVIATCNYEARRFGVHSAMASAQALRLCPDLKIIPPRFSVYKEASAVAHEVFRQYTDFIEPLSLDEAYLDVTGSSHCRGSATLIAEEIRGKIFQKLGVTVSAGVAPNKFLSKIASDWKKPNGLFVITPDQVNDFIFDLPVKKIHGVGKVTAEKLNKRGIKTCGQLRQYSILELSRWFGSFGEHLWNLSRGQDDREVQTSRKRKSLSVEHTYDHDLASLEEISAQVTPLLEELQARFKTIEKEYEVYKHVVKVKFADFTQTTLEEGLPVNGDSVFDHFSTLLIRAWERGKRPVRLLGLGVRLQTINDEKLMEQLELFEKKFIGLR